MDLQVYLHMDWKWSLKSLCKLIISIAIITTKLINNDTHPGIH